MNPEELQNKQEHSWASVYEIISGFNKYATEEVLFYAVQILGKEMGSKHVAIYTIANRDYARLFSATSLEARKLGNSIRYAELGELYSELKEGRIYVNRANEPDRPALGL